jgi:hypothetical protein
MTDMKKNMLVAAGIALVLAFSLNTSRAQNDAPPPGPAPATNQPLAPANAFQNGLNHFAADNPNQPPPGAFPAGSNQPQMQRLPPPRFRQPRTIYARTLSDLRAVKIELQHSPDDLGGHKDSAIEACDKAILELTAVMKALPPPPSPQRPMPPPGGPLPSPAAPQVAPPATPPAAAAPPAPPQP